MKRFEGRRGSALIIAILVIGLLAIIAISTTQTSRVETRIARNDRLYKTTFFQADGGVEMGIVLIETAIEERPLVNCTSAPCAYKDVAIRYTSSSDHAMSFYLNSYSKPAKRPCDPEANPSGCSDSDYKRDVYYYLSGNDVLSTLSTGQTSCSDPTAVAAASSNCVPVTQLKFGGETRLSEGGAIQMIAGYEGKGKGAAGGGAWIVYGIRSRTQGIDTSDSTVSCNWRHVM